MTMTQAYLSPHFTLAELCASTAAVSRALDSHRGA